MTIEEAKKLKLEAEGKIEAAVNELIDAGFRIEGVSVPVGVDFGLPVRQKVGPIHIRISL